MAAEIVALFDDGDKPPTSENMAVAAFDEWNRVAKIAGWPTANTLEPRKPSLRKALKNAGGLVGWTQMLEAAAESAFLTGKVKGKGSWRFTLDWVLKPANITKVLDGNYKDAPAPPPRETGRPPVNWRARLDTYRKGGFWLPSDGPRPEEVGPHQAPADMITEWRSRTHMPSNLAVPTESAEERIRATLRMYEARGRTADAQRVRAKLEALVGPGKGKEDATERMGFEPMDPVRGHGICLPLPSTTQPSLLGSAQNLVAPNPTILANPMKGDEEPPPWSGDVPET